MIAWPRRGTAFYTCSGAYCLNCIKMPLLEKDMFFPLSKRHTWCLFVLFKGKLKLPICSSSSLFNCIKLSCLAFLNVISFVIPSFISFYFLRLPNLMSHLFKKDLATLLKIWLNPLLRLLSFLFPATQWT